MKNFLNVSKTITNHSLDAREVVVRYWQYHRSIAYTMFVVYLCIGRGYVTA